MYRLKESLGRKPQKPKSAKTARKTRAKKKA